VSTFYSRLKRYHYHERNFDAIVVAIDAFVSEQCVSLLDRGLDCDMIFLK